MTYDAPAPTSKYAEALHKRLPSAHESARRHLKKAAVRQKRNYDKKMAGKPFQVGDSVWLHNVRRRKGRSPKLDCPWEGPFLVTAALSDVVYRIQKTRRAHPKVVHADRLKPYLGPSLESCVSALPDLGVGPTDTATASCRDVEDGGADMESPEDHSKSGAPFVHKDFSGAKAVHPEVVVMEPAVAELPEINDELEGVATDDNDADTETLPDKVQEDLVLSPAPTRSRSADADRKSSKTGARKEPIGLEPGEANTGNERRDKRKIKPPARFGDWVMSLKATWI